MASKRPPARLPPRRRRGRRPLWRDDAEPPPAIARDAVAVVVVVRVGIHALAVVPLRIPTGAAHSVAAGRRAGNRRVGEGWVERERGNTAGHGPRRGWPRGVRPGAGGGDLHRDAVDLALDVRDAHDAVVGHGLFLAGPRGLAAELEGFGPHADDGLDLAAAVAPGAPRAASSPPAASAAAELGHEGGGPGFGGLPPYRLLAGTSLLLVYGGRRHQGPAEEAAALAGSEDDPEGWCRGGHQCQVDLDSRSDKPNARHRAREDGKSEKALEEKEKAYDGRDGDTGGS